MLTDDARASMRDLRATRANLDAREREIRAGVQLAALDNGEREPLARLVTDTAAQLPRLTGDAMRAALVPWLAHATFDETARVLTVKIRHLPETPSLPITPRPGRLDNGQVRENCTVRRVVLRQARVGRPLL